MSKGGPFEAALSLLGGAALAIRGHAKDREKGMQDCKEIAAACIVLEAAGKITKEEFQNLIWAAEWAVVTTGKTVVWDWDNLKDLLESLPDKAK